MSETKHTHTPGPWEVAGFGSFIAPVDRNGSIICSMHGRESVYQGNSCEANARLIAAAPDLLVALEKWLTYDVMLRSLPGEGPLYGGQLEAVDKAYDACIEATKAALSKAEGSLT